MKKIVAHPFNAGIVILLGILFYNYLSNKDSNNSTKTSSATTDMALRFKGQNERISKSITYQTVSYEDTSV
jgi:CHASE3 domain sensor protein